MEAIIHAAAGAAGGGPSTSTAASIAASTSSVNKHPISSSVTTQNPAPVLGLMENSRDSLGASSLGVGVREPANYNYTCNCN